VFSGSVAPFPPSDANAVIDLIMDTPFSTNGLPTNYVCQSFDVGGSARHIVGIEALYLNTSGEEYVHHFLLYACSNAPSTVDETNAYIYHNDGYASPCLQGPNDAGGGLPSYGAFCHGTIFII
jgi:hypothetical protein